MQVLKSTAGSALVFLGLYFVVLCTVVLSGIFCAICRTWSALNGGSPGWILLGIAGALALTAGSFGIALRSLGCPAWSKATRLAALFTAGRVLIWSFPGSLESSVVLFSWALLCACALEAVRHRGVVSERMEPLPAVVDKDPEHRIRAAS